MWGFSLEIEKKHKRKILSILSIWFQFWIQNLIHELELFRYIQKTTLPP
jgi:hypothetical protein